MTKALATKNVAGIVLATIVATGIAFAFVSQTHAQSTTMTTSSSACFTFTRNASLGMTGGEIMQIQQFLNARGYTVSATGAGSPGNETSYFGAKTKAAVMAFQRAQSVSPVSGYWGPLSRAAANALCTSTGTTGGTTGGTTTGGALMVSASTQPANSLAPMKATRVPFTTFTLTNNSSAAVTINGVTVQRTGLANDNAFAGVILVDSTGMQYGNAQTFNASHQATIGGTFTLGAGQSMTYTVAGNMETSALGNAGQVASVSVVGINTTATVSGSLPITGAQQTINETLGIGTATIGLSGFDPNGSRSQAIGTTGLTFSGVRITAGSAEDQKLYSITWNQTGSAGSTDLGNLMTVVNGTSYPVTVDASGKYYTSTFPGGITITKGNSVDAYIKGDIVGSNSSGRTVEFDVYRNSDIYLVGQTYGYGIAPTTTLGGTYSVGNNSTSGGSNSSNPFYWGSTVTVTAGTLSTVASASSIAPNNIAVNVPNQVLGGFTTNFTGEPVTVQSIVVNVSTSSGATQLQNVTLVDQNGNVVAGPVDENVTARTITFNSSVTFPVGSMTYTIKGTVYTGATNGATYTLSTNPSAWTSAVGQTSGNYVSLPSTSITMSTMTVQAGTLNISASASPAATTVSQNQSNYTVANIVLDASNSGEDVRLNSLPIIISATSSTDAADIKTNLTNCQLWNGSTVLNSQSVGTSQWATVTGLANSGGQLSANGVESNFIFTNSLTVPKGTSVTLSLQCNLGGSFYNGEKFSAGVDTTYKPTVTGAMSGNTITPTVTSGTSGAQTVGTPTMTVSVPTPISYTQAAGGTTGVTVGTFTLQPTSGNVNLQKIALQLNSNYASSSDLANGVVTIWNGSTQVGSVSFNGVAASGGYYVATSTLASAVNLPQNVQTTLTLKADIASIGVGQSGTSGHEIRVMLSNAQGTSGNSQVNSGVGATPTTGVAIFKSYPIVAASSYLPSNGITDGRLIAFTVTASSGGNGIALDKLAFTTATSSNVTVTGVSLYAYSDSAFSQGAPGTTNGLAVGSLTQSGNNWTASFGTTPLQVAPGTTLYFLLKGTVSASAANYNVATTLNGDGSDLAPNVYAYNASALSGVNFIWSPNSQGTSAAATVDWTNGYGVSGLPSIGITQNRTQ